VKRIRVHDLRHTHATFGLGAGIHPKVMQERLVNAGPSLTYTEMSVALETRVPPETYAERKRGLLTERDAWEAKMTQV